MGLVVSQVSNAETWGTHLWWRNWLPQTWATRQSIASALQSQIATLDSSFLTDVWDWNLEVLTSNSTGSNTDWTINASVASNYPTLFPTPSFTATDTTMVDGTGARNGNGVLYGYVVPPGGYAPNGNLVAASDSASGDWAYFYDDLDRLTVAKAQSNVTAPSNYAGYFNCMKYDAYGNRLSEAMSTTLCGGTPPLDSWATYNPVNNQMKTSSMGTITYDFSGNVLSDGRNNYWYDAEGRVCASQVINGGSAYQYVYDAEGARIAIGTLSSVPKAPTNSCAAPFGSSFTTYSHELVDQSGDQVTEFDSGGNFTHTNVWIAGGLEATYDKTALHFNFEDPVGTKRAQANVLGQLDETCVSLPFGNDINDPYGVNCTAASNGLHTGDDDGEIHFSQKERDTETGNDYFLARYYNSAWGRFITPDWSVKVEPVPYAAFTDPQSLNLYAYVRNSPLIHIDADGHCCENLVNLTTSGSPITDAYQDVIFAGSPGDAIRNFFQNHSISAQIALQGVAGLFGESMDIEDVPTAPTMRAAQRMGMREQGIPTSQQPLSQERTDAGMQYTYEVPKPGGGTQTKIVQRNEGTDSSHPGEPHVEVGSPKATGQTDRIGRPRLTSDKTKVNVTQPSKVSDADLIRNKTKWQ